jgi:hypothetical protein
VPGDPPVWGTAQASLCVDLMVLGQHDPEDPLTWDVPRDFVESVVIESGKPALVIPDDAAVADGALITGGITGMRSSRAPLRLPCRLHAHQDRACAHSFQRMAPLRAQS